MSGNLTCRQCGKPITRRTYCSKRCAGLARRSVNRPSRYRHSSGRYEHIVIAAAALGRPIPTGAEVHHADGNSLNNHPSNLVICESHAYHQLLHRRSRALLACGDPDKLRCFACKSWDAPQGMYVRENQQRGIKAYHVSCVVAYNRQLAARKKAD